MIDHDRDEQIGAAVRAAAARVHAPDELRARLAATRLAPRRRRAPFVRLAAAGALAAALALAFVVLAGGAPSVEQVAAAALRPPTRPAPAPDPRDAARIDAEVGGVSFPSYERPWGWSAVGARTDEVEGRRAVTVIYRKGAQGAHYTIVSGEPLPRPEGAREVVRDGRRYSVVRDGATTVVSWRLGGHTCVLASRVLDADGLLRLAAWR